ncbi:nicotinate-nucleotide--dimethylbenzimidazole phosphoribosyltransferase [uncultured Dialister sp.]|uniref:nicotinate-nucleotide--dimethylbenzimidazole phosphoribosyltransferase n=1 Tax=uncultured Dialister sp. TaxID=278064 RepID=UPI0025F8B70A|nr:nicotinate-nucleotide--dimethylbenzimidazole phosphoribosyltransferase [uncultured Dialister sp.]
MNIPSLDENIMKACQLYVDNLIKPIHSLGKLEEIAVRIAGITREVKPSYLNKAIVIFGGDTAVDGENKTKGQLSHDEMKLVAQGYGPVNVIARQLEAPVYLIDAGLEKDTSDIEGILSKKMIHGTHHGHPAMDDEVVKGAITLGMSVAKTLAGQGIQAVGLGNIGERYPLSALAVTASIMKEDLMKVSAKGGFSLKLYGVGNFAENPVGNLAEVGSAEIAALFGFVVEAAKNRMMVVFDNAVTGAAVLAAVTVYPEIKNFVFPSVYYEEPVHQMQMQKMGMKAFLHYDFTEAEGYGSALGLSVLDAAIDMLNQMKTFGTADVAVAVDGPGKGRQREDVK